MWSRCLETRLQSGSFDWIQLRIREIGGSLELWVLGFSDKYQRGREIEECMKRLKGRQGLLEGLAKKGCFGPNMPFIFAIFCKSIVQF